MRTAILINVSLLEFEYMTPYELMLHVEAFLEKQQAELEEKVTLVWLVSIITGLKSFLL